MALCAQCGTNNIEGTRFCANCGTQIGQAPPPPESWREGSDLGAPPPASQTDAAGGGGGTCGS
jgi:hypothetical protein